jgi:hypothetical protein
MGYRVLSGKDNHVVYPGLAAAFPRLGSGPEKEKSVAQLISINQSLHGSSIIQVYGWFWINEDHRSCAVLRVFVPNAASPRNGLVTVLVKGKNRTTAEKDLSSHAI